MLYTAAIAVLGRDCLLRKVVEDCLVGWGTWHEIGQGSRGRLMRKEGRHDGAYDWTRLHKPWGKLLPGRTRSFKKKIDLLEQWKEGDGVIRGEWVSTVVEE